MRSSGAPSPGFKPSNFINTDACQQEQTAEVCNRLQVELLELFTLDGRDRWREEGGGK